MGNQQNPDGIYVPPGINKRYPLNLHDTRGCVNDSPEHLEKYTKAECNAELKAKYDRGCNGLHPESVCGEDCSGCVSPLEGGY